MIASSWCGGGDDVLKGRRDVFWGLVGADAPPDWELKTAKGCAVGGGRKIRRCFRGCVFVICLEQAIEGHLQLFVVVSACVCKYDAQKKNFFSECVWGSVENRVSSKSKTRWG